MDIDAVILKAYIFTPHSKHSGENQASDFKKITLFPITALV
jgi:hypothetical protein